MSAAQLLAICWLVTLGGRGLARWALTTFDGLAATGVVRWMPLSFSLGLDNPHRGEEFALVVNGVWSRGFSWGGVCLLAASLLATGVNAQTPKSVVLAVGTVLETLDPQNSNETLGLSMTRSFYQGLFAFDKDMHVVPALATSHQISADGLVYTMTLKSGVKFHDGSDFNAQAVKASFDRVTNPANQLKRYSLYQHIDRTEVIDSATVRFTLKQPYSAFLNALAHPAGGIISPSALQRYGHQGIARHPVGTGPFKFVSWDADNGLRAERFQGFARPGYPKVDSITWKLVRDNNARTEMVLDGRAQFAYPLPVDSINFFRNKPKLELVSTPSILQRYVAMNTQHKPFNDVRVRAAMNYAIDKQALIQTAFQGSGKLAVGVLPSVMEYAITTGPWPYDPGKARALLKEAGYPNGFETTLWSAHSHSTSLKAIEFMQQQLLQVGVKASVQALNPSQRQRMETHPSPDTSAVRMLFMGWSSSTGEADWALRPLFASPSMPPNLLNFSYYRNASVDAAIQQALTTSDKSVKARLYAQAQRQIWQDAPVIFLSTGQLVHVHARELTGIHVLADGSLLFDEIDRK